MELVRADRREQCSTQRGRTRIRPRLFGLLVALSAVLTCSAAVLADGAAAAPGARSARQSRLSPLSALNLGRLLRPSTRVFARPLVGSSFPAPGAKSLLVHVACTSAPNCWAVGGFGANNGAVLNQALHWNGKNWSQVSTPEPGGTSSGSQQILTGIACTSASNCWAVGYEEPSSGPQLNDALHWNGAHWSQVSTPDPGGALTGDTNELLGVACASATSCWAVGYTRGAYPAPELNQVLHWNGTHWSQASTPQPGGTSNGDTNELGILGGGVTCVSASSCWAVGFTQNGSGTPQLNQVMHWNGATWNQVSTPEPGGTGATDTNELTAVTCRSASNCSAVGESESGSSEPTLNQVLHWSGHTWVSAPVINPGGSDTGALNQLIGVACPAASNCSAVGAVHNSSADAAILNQALHWTGGAWLGTSTPNPGGANPGDTNELIGVACPSISNCWAVGVLGTSNLPINQILHWNGTNWAMG